MYLFYIIRIQTIKQVHGLTKMAVPSSEYSSALGSLAVDPVICLGLLKSPPVWAIKSNTATSSSSKAEKRFLLDYINFMLREAYKKCRAKFTMADIGKFISVPPLI